MPTEALQWRGRLGKEVQAQVPLKANGYGAAWLLPHPPSHVHCVLTVYAAGKAATSGVPSIYAPSTYAHLSPAKTPPLPTVIPMGPAYNGYPGGYPGDLDRSSSGEAGGSRNSWWGCAGHLDTEGQGLEGRGSWEPRRGSAPGEQQLTATLPQLVAKVPTYPCFGTQTAVWPLKSAVATGFRPASKTTPCGSCTTWRRSWPISTLLDLAPPMAVWSGVSRSLGV